MKMQCPVSSNSLTMDRLSQMRLLKGDFSKRVIAARALPVHRLTCTKCGATQATFIKMGDNHYCKNHAPLSPAQQQGYLLESRRQRREDGVMCFG